MKFKVPSNLFLVSILIASVLIFFISTRRTLNISSYYNSEYKDLYILSHPEKYPLYDIFKGKNELNGSDAFIDNSTWIKFLPEVYIHSAFEDKTKKNFNQTLIHILAIGPRVNLFKHKLQCVFQNNQSEWKTSLDDYAIIRHWSFRYFMFVCVSRNNLVPIKVGLEDESTQNKSPLLDIQYQNQKAFFKHELTVCVMPFFENSSKLHLVAEFLAYYNAVGVDSFIFYNYNMREDEIHLLNRITRLGINITIIPWTIPNASKLSRQRILEIASIHHCIFQNQGITKYVLSIKINEFLFPRQHFSLTELMNELSTISTLKVGSFTFHLSNFCSKQSTLANYKDDNLITSRDMIREDKMWINKKRKRYIARPETIIEGGLHYVRKHMKGWISANVPWQLALIHHYTTCTKTKYSQKLIEDRTADSFKYEILLSEPMKAYREFKSIKVTL